MDIVLTPSCIVPLLAATLSLCMQRVVPTSLCDRPRGLQLIFLIQELFEHERTTEIMMERTRFLIWDVYSQ